MVKDLKATLAATAAAIVRAQAQTAGRARPVPAWALPAGGMATRAEGGSGDGDCPESDEAIALHTVQPQESTRVCLSVERDRESEAAAFEDGWYRVEATNTGGAWAAIFAADSSLPVAVVPGQKLSLPSLEIIVGAFARAGARLAVASMGTPINLACKGASFFGLRCPKQVTDLVDPQQALADAIDIVTGDLALNEDGEATFYVSKQEASRTLYVATIGGLWGNPGSSTYPVPGAASVKRASAVLAGATVRDQIILPLVDLMVGMRTEDEVTAGRHGGEQSSSRTKTDNPKHRKEEPADAWRTDLVKTLFEVMRDSKPVATAANAFLDHVGHNGPTRTMQALATFAWQVLSYKKTVGAFILGATKETQEWMADAVCNAVTNFGMNAVPGIGWIKMVSTGERMVNVLLGTWKFAQALGGTAKSGIYAPIAPTDDYVLALTDWANYTDYFDVTDMNHFGLHDGELTTNSVDWKIQMIGHPLNGSIDGKPSAVVLVVDAHRDPQWSQWQFTLMTHVFQIQDGKPYLAYWTADDNASGFRKIGWTISGGKLLRYDMPWDYSSSAELNGWDVKKDGLPWWQDEYRLGPPLDAAHAASLVPKGMRTLVLHQGPVASSAPHPQMTWDPFAQMRAFE